MDMHKAHNQPKHHRTNSPDYGLKITESFIPASLPPSLSAYVKRHLKESANGRSGLNIPTGSRKQEDSPIHLSHKYQNQN